MGDASRRRIGVVLLAVLAVVTMACSGDGDGKDDAKGGSTTSTSARRTTTTVGAVRGRAHCDEAPQQGDGQLRVTGVDCQDGFRLTRWSHDADSRGSAILEQFRTEWTALDTYGTDCPGGAVATSAELQADGLPAALADEWGEPPRDDCEDAASTDVGPSMFMLPSDNIGCLLSASDVRCDIREHTYDAPAHPADCPVDYGDSIALDDQRAFFSCHGDTVLGGPDVLQYGQTARRGQFECTSSTSGVICRDVESGHGFTLARASYTLR